ncbi:MAG TPA: hypothetical protein PK878_09080 [bacterium]|nr:hypothetical protein [bacterium]HPP00366.1 hypothetical protein [bacterium]HXK95618.1 hypothetical protein [bacterium]
MIIQIRFRLEFLLGEEEDGNAAFIFFNGAIIKSILFLAHCGWQVSLDSRGVYNSSS